MGRHGVDERAPAVRRVGLLPLVASLYFMVSGGPYGLEDLVACGYPVALTALVVTPLVWSLPTALLVGELASALPEEGGYYAWVRRALGPFWGFQEAWLSLAASVFDMAIYPTLFALYAARLTPALGKGAWPATLGLGLIALCTLWNLGGARSVGRSALVFALLLLAPFVALSALGYLTPHLTPHLLAASPVAPALGIPASSASTSQASFVDGVLVVLWNYMGWDNASTIAGEVEEPQRTYPRALGATLLVVGVSYLVPVGALRVAGIDPSGWTTGSWVGAAGELAGRISPGFARALSTALVLGGALCGAGMFNALLLAYSRLPAVLADDGLLPRVLARRDARGTPWVAILVCAVAYAACLGLGFERLVALDVLLYGAGLALELVALFVLRLREPDLPRPFKIPGGLGVVALFGAPPLALLALALWQCRAETVGPLPSLLLAASIVGCGPILYALRRRT